LAWPFKRSGPIVQISQSVLSSLGTGAEKRPFACGPGFQLMNNRAQSLVEHGFSGAACGLCQRTASPGFADPARAGIISLRRPWILLPVSSLLEQRVCRGFVREAVVSMSSDPPHGGFCAVRIRPFQSVWVSAACFSRSTKHPSHFCVWLVEARCRPFSISANSPRHSIFDYLPRP